MMQHKSSLNADAAPYVPISKNSDVDNKAAEKVISVSEKTEDVGEAVGCQLPVDVSLEESLVKLHVSDKSSSDKSTIQEYTFAAENQNMTDDRQTAIDFLMTVFSGYSEKSIAELLDFCDGDVVVAIDMLEQLELNEHVETPGTSEV